jgi:2-furoyl-CoA dehydrogenase large subunit
VSQNSIAAIIPQMASQGFRVPFRARTPVVYAEAVMDPPERTQKWLGQPLERLEDARLLRGKGRFLDDLDPAPGSLHAAVVRSPFAHARITSIDATAALDMMGVVAVVTGEQLTAVSRPFPAVIDSPFPLRAAAVDNARYAGEPVAVVVARDRYTAEDARDLVVVDYEPLDAVTDPGDAVNDGLVASDRSFSYGDADEALAGAALIVRERFNFPRWNCTPIECSGVVCDWSEASQSLTAWANFQGPFTLHSVAAGALGLSATKLRLITPEDSGGSFGVKASVYVYVVLMGAVSRYVGRPIRWIEDRLEQLAASSSSTERTTEIEAGFSAAGELLGLKYDVIEDVGAYVRAPEPATLYRMHGCLSGAYRVSDVAVRNRVVLTNRCPTGLNRGFGGPQLYFAIERMMHIAARRLGIDHAELIRTNLVGSNEFPYETPTGGLYDSGDYEACLDKALRLADYPTLQTESRAARAEGRLIGVGLAVVVEPSISNMGYISLAETAEERATSLPKSGNAEGAAISMNPLGGVSLSLSTTPQGQGHATVAAQIVADALGLSPDEIDVVASLDTSTSPWTVSSGAYSSRFAGVGAAAIRNAANVLGAKLRRIAADHLECSPDDIELVGGRACVAGNPERGVSLRRVAGAAHWNPESLPADTEPGLSATAFASTPNLSPPDENDRVVSSGSHGFIVDIAVVEIDRATGAVAINDYVTVHDSGTLLNPLIVEGQIRGGFAHGLGAALQERMVYDEDGNLLTSSFMDYLCMTAPEVSDLTITHHCSPSPFTPFGAKGLGEGNTMSTPAAVANAVADAIDRDLVELPLTAPRVWELIQTAEVE